MEDNIECLPSRRKYGTVEAYPLLSFLMAETYSERIDRELTTSLETSTFDSVRFLRIAETWKKTQDPSDKRSAFLILQ